MELSVLACIRNVDDSTDSTVGFLCPTLHLFSIVRRCQKDRADNGRAWELNLKASLLLRILIGASGARKFLLRVS